MFSKILIANRGEIAVRIIRACKEMGVATVAVYSEADKNALHVALADQSYCIGDPEASESYLNENQIISTAILAGAQAIHPGYGFLSENAHFSDGIAAFEVTAEGLVKPLYATENICEFFGYTEKEWLSLTERYTPVENFVAYSEVAYENFAELLKTGEAEFTYFDYQSETERKIKAICSAKEPNANFSRYVMLYPVEGSSEVVQQTLPENRTVSIRTFGYFDIFVGDTPLAFRNKKSKELLALLVDRKGGYVTSEEAISFLWEDEPANTLTLSRYRKVALRLKSTLEEYGITDIVEAVDGKRRIVMNKVECDLYNYLSGKEEFSQLFKGSYMTNYSWGETTLGELMNEEK